MATFSRLQLAAALLEYDNDPTNPSAPYRSAQDSAIFAQFRRNADIHSHVVARKSGYLGVSLPSETASLGDLETAVDGRRSRGSRSSLDALRNPFGVDDAMDEEEKEEHEDLEVDLASWGLDAFLPKDKRSKRKGKARANQLSSRVPEATVSPQQSRFVSDTIPRRPAGVRSLSLGSADVASNPPETRLAAGDASRRSLGPLDDSNVQSNLSDNGHDKPLHYLIPFPSTSTRSPSPPPTSPRGRTHTLISDAEQAARDRSISNATIATAFLADDNPFTLNPPAHASRFDPKAALHARTISNASVGTRMLDGASVITGAGQGGQERPYSTIELLRPKVLVMPSPLQSTNIEPPTPAVKIRDGFQLSADGPPLPPGARSARPSSTTLPMLEPTTPATTPIAANSFIPNPRASLTLSQLTFRNQLLVGGQRDVSYSDLDAIPRATTEGEQIQIEPDLEAKPEDPSFEDATKTSRPAGKLYGKSLIDDLENRKAEMRGKQRVFTGDQRPSMMVRGQAGRLSTLIDPNSLLLRRATDRQTLQPQPLGRRNSANIQPLLNFDDEMPNPTYDEPPKVLNSRSVFGVDTLWEREMAKLREIEKQEKLEERQEAERETQSNQGKKSKAKRQTKSVSTSDVVDQPQDLLNPAPPRVSIEPPVLPSIPKTVRAPPKVEYDIDSDDSDGEDLIPPQVTNIGTDNWHAGSSDEESNGPLRTIGTGPRYPKVAKTRIPISYAADDSDEDLPLAATMSRASQTARSRIFQKDSDEEEKPLSALLAKTKLSSPTTQAPDTQSAEDTDDDQPLGLRVSRTVPFAEDDDMPLAFHPEQQRKTQFQITAQQHLMLQAQATSSMFFGQPSILGYGPPIAAPVVPPLSIPSPPLHDAAKFGRVDRWRRDVAVEGGR